jgi:large subunit ribosomal protein L24e
MFCVFCNREIPKGMGLLYVKRDGTTLPFCSSKCKRNMLELGREGRHMKWTAKQVALVHEKKEEEKKESALAKEIEAKLAERKAKEGKEGQKK